MDLKGKTVIITDDGIATGATMQAAIWAVHNEEPQQIIVALPVGPPDRLPALEKSADKIICLQAPLMFSAVGQFYANFEQTSDEEVIAVLQRRIKVPKE